MTKSNQNENANAQSFNIEPLENRDAPKVAGGGSGDDPLERGGGKPSKVR